MEKRLLVTLCCLFSFLGVLSQKKSFINDNCEAVYWNDSFFPAPPGGILFLYPQIDTTHAAYANMFEQVYKFSPSQYYLGGYDSIRLKDSLHYSTGLNTSLNYYYNLDSNYAYKQSDPVMEMSFSFFGIMDTVYTTFSPKSAVPNNSDTEICFFIIPGSNSNQTTELIRGTGYHNLNGKVVNNLKRHGDVYIYTKPNEDFRAIRNLYSNDLKMKSDNFPSNTYINNYLNSHNRQEGINVLTQALAVIKNLKKKYVKVFLMGCSQGGYTSLLASMESEVDAVLISSGYSVTLDTDMTPFGNIPPKFANLPYAYTRDSIREKIKTLKTQYYFTWPYIDELIYQNENQFHHTQNYFSNFPYIDNVNYYYDYYNHSFPPTYYLDSIISTITGKAKANFKDTLSSCLRDSMVVRVGFFGKPPFSYQLFRNDTLTSNHFTTGMVDTVVLYNEGKYVIKNIVDSASVVGINSECVVYRKPKKSILEIENESFLCDSLKSKINIKMKGVKPFHLTIHKVDTLGNTSIFSQYPNTDSMISVLLPEAKYYFDFQDSLSCHSIRDSVNLVDPNFPNYKQVVFNTLSPIYLCEKDSTELLFDIEFVKPVSIVYRLNNAILDSFVLHQNKSVIVTNGDYQWLYISDPMGCVVPLQGTTSIAESPLKISEFSAEINCEKKNISYTILPEGKAPWNLNYQNNGQNYSKTFNQLPIVLDFEEGIHSLISITDQNQCLLNLNKSATIYPFFDQKVTLSLKNNKLIANQTANKFYWYKDSELIDTTSGNTIDYRGYGSYEVHIKDRNECIKTSDVLTFDNGNIDIFPNPASNFFTILMNGKTDACWNVQLHDITGKQMYHEYICKSISELNLQGFPEGLYFVTIHYTINDEKKLFKAKLRVDR